MESSGMKRRGRPRKNIDEGVMFHMMKNKAPITAVARYLGIHRDTIYVNFSEVIKDARKAYEEKWRVLAGKMAEQFFERHRLRESAKMKKRKYSTGYFNRWDP